MGGGPAERGLHGEDHRGRPFILSGLLCHLSGGNPRPPRLHLFGFPLDHLDRHSERPRRSPDRLQHPRFASLQRLFPGFSDENVPGISSGNKINAIEISQAAGVVVQSSIAGARKRQVPCSPYNPTKALSASFPSHLITVITGLRRTGADQRRRVPRTCSGLYRAAHRTLQPRQVPLLSRVSPVCCVIFSNASFCSPPAPRQCSRLCAAKPTTRRAEDRRSSMSSSTAQSSQSLSRLARSP